MVDTGTGTLYIVGSFKRMTTDPDFKVYIVPFRAIFFCLGVSPRTDFIPSPMILSEKKVDRALFFLFLPTVVPDIERVVERLQHGLQHDRYVGAWL